MLSRKHIPVSGRYKSNANKALECSVASPEATKKRPHRRDDIGDISPFKTWGKSRSLRLKDFDYASAWTVYHVNMKAFREKKIFSNSNINQQVVEILKSSAKLHGYDLLSYCLMPDHLHILVQAGEFPKDLSGFVRGFKSFSSRSTSKKLWQRGFYEHILRKEENLADVAKYILENPMRKRLVEEHGQYMWCELLINDCDVTSSEATQKTSSQE